MRVKKVADSEHGPRHVTAAGRSVFYDLFPAEKAAEMEMRAKLLMGLDHWLEKSRMTQAEAAKVLGVTQARVSDLKRGKIDRFSMDLLVRLGARAGLKPKLKLAAYNGAMVSPPVVALGGLARVCCSHFCTTTSRYWPPSKEINRVRHSQPIDPYHSR
jgi:predicted XRE-type DNA-binding protein